MPSSAAMDAGALPGRPAGEPAVLAITGCSVHLPGADLPGALDRVLPAPTSGPGSRSWAVRASAASCPPEQAATLLGRKGLLAKEPATRLALCAVHRALGLAAGQRARDPLRPDTAVVACSNLGNVGTVVDIVRTVAAEGGRAVSVLAAPSASSNIVASTVALWFGFAGPNLMVCSGRAAGGDGLHLAGLLVRAGRARRVVLVAAEPDDPVASALYGGPLRAGSGCVVLEPAGATATLATVAPAADGVVAPSAAALGLWGDCYGALGVVDLAVAAHLVAEEGQPQVKVSFDGAPPGRRAVLVRAEA